MFAEMYFTLPTSKDRHTEPRVVLESLVADILSSSKCKTTHVIADTSHEFFMT